MKKNLNLLMAAVAAATALVATSPAQAQSVTLSVTGTLKPTSCLPTLSGGGTLDWGDISQSSILPDAPNKLGGKQIGFSIKCEAKTAVAIKVIDNRPESVVPGITFDGNGAPLSSAFIFGLGSVGGKSLGSYSVSLVNATFTGDNQPVSAMRRPISSDTWTSLASLSRPFMSTSNLYTWGAPGTTVPGAFDSIVGQLYVLPILNKGLELPRQNEIILDGSLSIELAYL
jgi:hypothetical protein